MFNWFCHIFVTAWWPLKNKIANCSFAVQISLLCPHLAAIFAHIWPQLLCTTQYISCLSDRFAFTQYKMVGNCTDRNRAGMKKDTLCPCCPDILYQAPIWSHWLNHCPPLPVLLHACYFHPPSPLLCLISCCCRMSNPAFLASSSESGSVSSPPLSCTASAISATGQHWEENKNLAVMPSQLKNSVHLIIFTPHL